ncbi:hypothetical protein BC835DRAFT_1382707 [Cytidiella melzeri]|nr:hypothetical protein BC835DRAFT_1382707 [Cytidiella melzeri]
MLCWYVPYIQGQWYMLMILLPCVASTLAFLEFSPITLVTSWRSSNRCILSSSSNAPSQRIAHKLPDEWSPQTRLTPSVNWDERVNIPAMSRVSDLDKLSPLS